MDRWKSRSLTNRSAHAHPVVVASAVLLWLLVTACHAAIAPATASPTPTKNQAVAAPTLIPVTPHKLAWTVLSPATSPDYREYPSLAYDAPTGKVVLFGGCCDDGGNSYAETWTFDGKTWTQEFPLTTPPARYHGSMAYDPATKTIVLFGGTNGQVQFADTWTFDGKDWKQQSPVTAPPARTTASLAYDASSKSLLLFGGLVAPGQVLNDTWAWDGTNWLRRTPSVVPPPRFYASMAADPASQAIVLFGGYGQPCNAPNGDCTILGDTWTWDGTTWIQRAPTPSPPARDLASMTYDQTTKSILMFGGSGPPCQSTGDCTYFNDLWRWDGNAWSKQTTDGSPSPRQGSDLVYDDAIQAVVLLGGHASDESPSDTWALK